MPRQSFQVMKYFHPPKLSLTLFADVRKPTTLFDEKLGGFVESLQMAILEYHKATTKRAGAC